MRKLYTASSMGIAVALTIFMGMPVYASLENINHNPATGDTMGQYLPIVIGALVVSAVIIIVLAVMSKKGKKGKPGNKAGGSNRQSPRK